MRPPPRYRSLAKPALLAAGASLLAFGLAHAAFITWAVDRSEDASLLLRLGIMLGAPILVGAVPSLATALAGAYAWRATWGTRLASPLWGLAMTSALLPALLLNLVHGPTGDSPPAWMLPVVLGGVLALPALVGVALARSARGLLAGAATLPVGAMLSMFIQAEAFSGWVLPFVVATVAILGASGWLMARLVARAAPPEAFSPGAVSEPA
ncbi:MAG TPA: hypothetical protein VM582_07185 [Candidatus Thermoplasmatota archaeon]|nr:hypothetical protein [Candidatus Thermoplasmatota archaeon]